MNLLKYIDSKELRDEFIIPRKFDNGQHAAERYNQPTNSKYKIREDRIKKTSQIFKKIN